MHYKNVLNFDVKSKCFYKKLLTLVDREVFEEKKGLMRVLFHYYFVTFLY